MALRMLVAAGCVLSSPVLAQEPDAVSGGSIEGKWTGAVVLPTGGLPFSVTFERADEVLSAAMDIQGQLGLPLTAVSYIDGRGAFSNSIPPFGLARGTDPNGDTIEGNAGSCGTHFSPSREFRVFAEPGTEEAGTPTRAIKVSLRTGTFIWEHVDRRPKGTGPFRASGPITGNQGLRPRRGP